MIRQRTNVLGLSQGSKCPNVRNIQQTIAAILYCGWCCAFYMPVFGPTGSGGTAVSGAPQYCHGLDASEGHPQVESPAATRACAFGTEGLVCQGRIGSWGHGFKVLPRPCVVTSSSWLTYREVGT